MEVVLNEYFSNSQKSLLKYIIMYQPLKSYFAIQNIVDDIGVSDSSSRQRIGYVGVFSKLVIFHAK